MPKFLSDAHFVGSATDITLDGQLFLPSTTSDPGTALPISFDSGAGGIYYDSNDDHLWFRAANNKRAYISSAGIISQANVYSGTSNQFRNYAGTWAGTTGTANNGFYFLNNSNSNTTKAMDLSHDGNVVFNGYVRGTIFADKDATAFYVNPGAGANSNAAVLRGQIKIGTHANANTIYSDGGKTQIATHNSKSKYAANGQYNGITVLANDARKDNTAMATTALVLANTASNSSTKSLLRLNRTDGRYNQDSWSSGQGSFNTRFDIRGNGDVIVTGNIRTTQDIGRDNHNRIMFSTDDSIIYRIADSHRFRMDSDNLSPYADSSYDLGTNSVRWRNVYADTLYGDGSNLTNLPSGSTTTINNNADNRVITGSGTANTLEAESGLTFDGDILEIVGSGTTTKRLKVSPSTDYGRAHIGRAALGKLGFDDHAGFAHEDQNGQNTYALLQSSTGNTYVNAASGKAGYLRIDNSTIGYWNANGLYVSIYYDKDNTDFYANPASRSQFGSLTLNSGAVWDDTTQGTSIGSLHLDPNSSTDHAGGAITFGASDSSSGTTAQAGIYIRSDGSYGTRMYFSTTDSYASGSKTAMYINHDKTVYFKHDINLDDNNMLLWGGNSIVKHTGSATQIGDNSSGSVLTLSGGNADFSGEVEMASGNATGKFAVMSTAPHASYDFYNNGTSYFNGAVTVDDSLLVTSGTATISQATTNLLTLKNTTNGGGAGIIFDDHSANTQKIYLRGYHSDGSSQGGGASLHLASTEADLVFVVGSTSDASYSGRIVVQSHHQTGEVDYGFVGDTNTGVYSPAAGQVGLVSDGSRVLLASSNGVTINNGNLYIPAYLYHADDTNTYLYFGSDRIEAVTGGTSMLQFNKNYYGNRYTGLETGIGLHSENLGGANLIKKGTDIAVATGYREEITGPDGNRKVQAHVSTGSGNTAQCYQWYSSENVVVNPEKDYEFSVWVKSEGDHNLYLGWHEYKLDGTQISSNPYFHTSTINTSSVRNVNGWVLLKYQLKSHRTASGTADTEGSDRYASNNASSDFKTSGSQGVMHSTTKLVHIRMGTCYGNTNTTKTYFYNPKITEAQSEEIKWTSLVAKGIATDSYNAPVFYDKNNTTYYLDASSTGTSLNVAGNIASSGNITATSSGTTTVNSVSTGNWAGMQIQSSDAASAYLFFNDTSGERARIQSTSSNDLKFSTNGGGSLALTLDSSTNATFEETVTIKGDLDVQGSGITLVDSISFSGTGRIQGIDTVSAGTDAVNKNYVDNNFASADTTYSFNFGTQLSANTWTDTGIDGGDMLTGTYIMQVEVTDHNLGGGHYTEFYSGVISWMGGATNSTMHDEIPVHRAGHAPNNGDIQFRTLRASGSDTHDLMLQVKHNQTYNAAPDQTSGKVFKFHFRKMI